MLVCLCTWVVTMKSAILNVPMLDIVSGTTGVEEAIVADPFEAEPGIEDFLLR